MKKIITVLFLGVLPFTALAEGSWATKEEGGYFFIEGGCTGKKVKIEFFSREENREPNLKFDIPCERGHFFSRENLQKKKLPVGNYILAVDGEKTQTLVSVTEEKSRESENNAERMLEQSAGAASADSMFLNALVDFQQSVLDMQTWLSETKYSGIIKDSLGSILDGIQILSAKISDLLWSADNPENISEEEPVVPEVSVKKESAVKDSAEESAITDITSYQGEGLDFPEKIRTENESGSQAEILSLEGLSISGGN